MAAPEMVRTALAIRSLWVERGLTLCAAREPTDVEARLRAAGIAAPDDFVTYLAIAGGVAQDGDWDPWTFSFWRLGRVIDEWLEDTWDARPIHVTPFVDYCIDSAAYGVAMDSHPHPGAVVELFEGGRILAPSLADFLRRYVEDTDRWERDMHGLDHVESVAPEDLPPRRRRRWRCWW